MSEMDDGNTVQPKPEPVTATDWEAEAEKWKELAKKNEKRAKENAEKAKSFDALEESQKSELQKAADAQRLAEERAAAAERNAVRLQVALSKGLTATQAKRLVGETEEELAADADEILESFAPRNSETKEPLRGPREVLRSGARPNDEPDPDIAEVVSKIPRTV